MKRVGAVFLVVFLVAAGARAEVIYSNLAGNGTYSAGGGSVIRGQNAIGPLSAVSQAVGFTPAQTVQLGWVQLGLHNSSQSVGDATEVLLYDRDPGGGPGAVIESLGIQSGFPAQFTSDSFLVTYTSTTNPLLQAGVEYFIVAIAGDSAASASWMDNATGVVGSWDQSGSNDWDFEASFPPGALRIYAVPEPASAALLMIGGPALLRRWH